MLSDGTFEFDLRKPIEVAGVRGDVETLTFHECGEGYDGYYMKLRKFIMSGIMAMPKLLDQFKGFKEDVGNEDAIASGEELKNLHEVTEDDHKKETDDMADMLKMALGTSDDLGELINVFGSMFSVCSGNPICTSDGIRLKKAAWDRIHIEDKISVAVKYCAFFGIGLDALLSKEPETAPELPMEVTAL